MPPTGPIRLDLDAGRSYPPAEAEMVDAAEGSGVAGASLVGRVAVWNPFDDPSPFCQLSEDHLFGAEFDKIRRGSQSSKPISVQLTQRHLT